MNNNRNILNDDNSSIISRTLREIDFNDDSSLKRAVTYNRCSTEEEVQVNALATQVEESREIAESKGWIVVDQYVELKSGTSTKRRTEYLRLLEDIEYDKFDIIVIKSIDRLMRSTRDWYIFIDKVQQHKKKLFIYMDNKFYVPDDALLTGIRAILAEEFSRELSKKIKNAHAGRQKKQSGYNFIKAPFGWNKLSQTEYEINEDEAYYYRLAFAMLHDGKGFHVIARYMAEQGVINRQSGKVMSETQWRNLLYSPRAHGEVILHKYEYDFNTKKRYKLPEEEWIHIENALPPIVSKEYQEMILEEHRKRASQYGDDRNKDFSNKGQHLLSGKLKCGCCGASYYRNSDIKSNKHTWRCSNKTYFGMSSCKGINVFDDTVIQIVEQACKDFYDKLFGTNEDSIIEETLRVARKAMKSNSNQRLLQKLQKDLSEQEKKKRVLFDKLMNEVISDEDFKMFNRGIEQKIEELKNKIVEIESAISNLADIEERIAVIRKEMRENHMVQRAETKELFEKIDYIIVHTDSQLEIVFKKPSLMGIFSLNKIPIDVNNEDLFRIKVPYTYKKKYEIERERNTQRIYDVLRDNPNSNLTTVGELLGLKTSYVSTSIKILKDQGKIYYKRTGEHTGEWVIVEE